MKRILGCFMVMALAITSVAVPGIKAAAASKDSVPTKVRVYSTEWESNSIKMELAEYGTYVDNLKTSSSNLIAKVTNIYANKSENELRNEVTISTFAKKNGTYTVSFDLMNADGTKKASKKVKLYVYNWPVKSVTINGKTMKSNIISAKSGKVKVKLTKGNTIKKLEYGVYNKTGKMTYKTFKNGAKIIFGNYPYLYNSGNESEGYSYKSYSTSILASTNIRVTYKDKYTKKNETLTFSYEKIVK